MTQASPEAAGGARAARSGASTRHGEDVKTEKATLSAAAHGPGWPWPHTSARRRWTRPSTGPSRSRRCSGRCWPSCSAWPAWSAAGANLNQAVARLNATGEPGPDLGPSAAYCTRVLGHVDEAAELIRRRLG